MEKREIIITPKELSLTDQITTIQFIGEDPLVFPDIGGFVPLAEVTIAMKKYLASELSLGNLSTEEVSSDTLEIGGKRFQFAVAKELIDAVLGPISSVAEVELTVSLKETS